MSQCLYVFLGIALLQAPGHSNMTLQATPHDIFDTQELVVDDLKDLLLTSIQNTISLNDLVTQLTQKIVNIMLSVGETTTKVEEMEKTFTREMESMKINLKEEIVAVQQSIQLNVQEIQNSSETNHQSLETQLETLKDSSETDLQSLEEKVETLKNSSETSHQSLETQLEALQDSSETDHQSSEEKLETLKNSSETNHQSLETQLETLKENSEIDHQSLETLKDTVDAIETSKKEAVIVSAEGGLRDSNCVKVCAGSTLNDFTNWQGGGHGYVYIDVDIIRECGFVTVPTLTASLDGNSSNWVAGSPQVHVMSNGKYRIYIKTTYSNSYVRNSKWNVEWIAIGYTC